MQKKEGSTTCELKSNEIEKICGKEKTVVSEQREGFSISEVEHNWWVHEKDNKWSIEEFKFKNYVHIWFSCPGHNDITLNGRK